jgi:deoxyhypusine synthase
VNAPVTEGSLSSCPPAEAVTWGKVDREGYVEQTESMQGDYSMVMPFIVKALLDNRKRYARLAREVGETRLFRKEPKARGYLRPQGGYRLFESRERLTGRLFEEMKKKREWLKKTLHYPL